VKVFVTGGTGYIGQVVVRALIDRNHQVRLLQRPMTKREPPSQVEVVTGDLFDSDVLEQACHGMDAVIHLVGVIREHPRQGITMHRVHVDGTAAIVSAAKRAGVERFIHMSALRARENATSTYHRSKWASEQTVRDSKRLFTIFRPSVVFGEGGSGSNFVGLLRNLVASTPIVPMIGDGQFLLQPVSVETVAQAFASALDTERSIDKVYELGGPDVLTYHDILARIACQLNKPLRTFPIPIGVMRRLVPILQHFPAFPLTVDQLTMLTEGNVCNDTTPAYEDLCLQPIPFQLA
jgi:uncharacterized protein YbjT (DUF2867 family)